MTRPAVNHDSIQTATLSPSCYAITSGGCQAPPGHRPPRSVPGAPSAADADRPSPRPRTGDVSGDMWRPWKRNDPVGEIATLAGILRDELGDDPRHGPRVTRLFELVAQLPILDSDGDAE